LIVIPAPSSTGLRRVVVGVIDLPRGVAGAAAAGLRRLAEALAARLGAFRDAFEGRRLALASRFFALRGVADDFLEEFRRVFPATAYAWNARPCLPILGKSRKNMLPSGSSSGCDRF
jgi:hypothetical protein